jgi:hypothetical protein
MMVGMTEIGGQKRQPGLRVDPSKRCEWPRWFTPPPAQTEVAEQTLPVELPKTASPFPLIGLFGLLALGGALALRAVESRIQ